MGAGAVVLPAWPQLPATRSRSFHLCVSPAALEADPDLLDLLKGSGVDTLWIAGFLYGYWYTPAEQLAAWRSKIEAAGMGMQVVNVPLGHPGDSLGAMDGNVPLTPPKHWKLGTRPDGSTYAGTSLHDPAAAENAAAVKAIAGAGFQTIFVDDDFRLAQGPGTIGGCFCEEHKRRFLSTHGFSEAQWEQLLGDIKSRSLTQLLCAWRDFTCDDLSACFRAMQQAAPQAQVGNMIMYLGAEKAGIRLRDYRDAPFRVGELMFDDRSFGTVKGKTNELFSVLFHRRYAQPHLAYSETTAFPANQLSAANMAAKLAISTITDVRNTMMMSGLSPFPKTHWDTLAPAMRKQAEFHEKLAGQTPRGPLKHFWGEAGRSVSDDNPYSLFLAMGIPFEVIEVLPREGWVFLSDADARMVAETKHKEFTGLKVVARKESPPDIHGVPEELDALFALKREIVPSLQDIPFVANEVPAVCAWYPESQRVFLWNLTEERQELRLKFRVSESVVPLAPLESAVLDVGGM